MNTMDTKRIVVAAAACVLLGAGVAAGYWWARHIGESPRAAPESIDGGSPTGTPAAPRERRVLYWHDPMVPGTRFDKPGKSPFMDMELVPVYAEDDAADGGVRIAPGVTQNLGIRLGRVERRELVARTEATGSVVLDERLARVVAARVDGYVARLHVAAPLTRVRRGAPLVDVIAPAWQEAAHEYLVLLDSPSPQVGALRDAVRARLSILGMPDAALAAIESERRVPEATTLAAPRDGVVTELGARAGAAFATGATLFRINGLETVWVEAAIPEATIAAVAPGDTVQARATAWPGERFDGRLLALLPSVAADTRTLTARVAVDNRAGRLAPGMYLTLEFTGAARAPELSVPSEAVIRTGTRNVVITTAGGGRYSVAAVETGAEREGCTVILRGLDEGQSVVLSGQFLIDSEASLRASLDRLDVASTAAPAAADEPGSAPAAHAGHEAHAAESRP